jgi:hypothetical protein
MPGFPCLRHTRATEAVRKQIPNPKQLSCCDVSQLGKRGEHGVKEVPVVYYQMTVCGERLAGSGMKTCAKRCKTTIQTL